MLARTLDFDIIKLILYVIILFLCESDLRDCRHDVLPRTFDVEARRVLPRYISFLYKLFSYVISRVSFCMFLFGCHEPLMLKQGEREEREGEGGGGGGGEGGHLSDRDLGVTLQTCCHFLHLR